MEQAFFDRSTVDVARSLIGAELLVGGVGGIIVEIEAYMPDDAASHSFNGRTPRDAAMFGVPGSAYVYRAYGLHWCLNAVCLPGSAVLLRALQPTAGVETMIARRGVGRVELLAAGPGRLCESLEVDLAHNGLSLLEPPFELRWEADNVLFPRDLVSASHEMPNGVGGSVSLAHASSAENFADAQEASCSSTW